MSAPRDPVLLQLLRYARLVARIEAVISDDSLPVTNLERITDLVCEHDAQTIALLAGEASSEKVPA